MQETDPLFRAASDQYKIMKKSLAKPSEGMAAQDELTLREKAFIACMARLASRIKTLEDDNKQIKDTLHKIATRRHDE